MASKDLNSNEPANLVGVAVYDGVDEGGGPAQHVGYDVQLGVAGGRHRVNN